MNVGVLHASKHGLGLRFHEGVLPNSPHTPYAHPSTSFLDTSSLPRPSTCRNNSAVHAHGPSDSLEMRAMPQAHGCTTTGSPHGGALQQHSTHLAQLPSAGPSAQNGAATFLYMRSNSSSRRPPLATRTGYDRPATSESSSAYMQRPPSRCRHTFDAPAHQISRPATPADHAAQEGWGGHGRPCTAHDQAIPPQVGPGHSRPRSSSGAAQACGWQPPQRRRTACNDDNVAGFVNVAPVKLLDRGAARGGEDQSLGAACLPPQPPQLDVTPEGLPEGFALANTIVTWDTRRTMHKQAAETRARYVAMIQHQGSLFASLPQRQCVRAGWNTAAGLCRYAAR